MRQPAPVESKIRSPPGNHLSPIALVVPERLLPTELHRLQSRIAWKVKRHSVRHPDKKAKQEWKAQSSNCKTSTICQITSVSLANACLDYLYCCEGVTDEKQSVIDS